MCFSKYIVPFENDFSVNLTTMHALLSMSAIFTLIHSAEIPQKPPTFDIKKAQTKMIRSALNDISTKIVRGNADNRADICDWDGIECTDGVVTTFFVYTNHFSDGVGVEIEWLPPTLEFVHMKSARITSGSSLSTLPRALKYLYCGFCYGLPKTINCSELPPKMEELIIAESSFVSAIYLDGLPQGMRYVYFSRATAFMEVIGINYDNLPDSIEEIRVTAPYEDKQLKRIVTTVGKPSAVKLQTKNDPQYPTKGSLYLEAFEQRKP